MGYFLYLAAFLAVAGLGHLMRNRWPALGKGLMITGCVCCVVLIGSRIRTTFGGSAAIEPDRYQAAASYVLATQVTRELGGQRGQVVLILPPERSMDKETMETSVYVFARVLHAAPSLQLRVTNLVVTGRAKKSSTFPPASFEQATANDSTPLAYVSFAGGCSGIESLSLFQREPAPKFFVFDPSGTTTSDWLPALKKGVIQCVVVPRPNSRTEPDEEIHGRPEDIFNQFFLLATPRTADDVAAQLNAQ